MFERINSFLGTSVAFILIFAGAVFFVRIRFLRLIFPSHALKKSDKQGRKNGVSPFRALTLALAGTLGVGNIVGVATAIYLGGFGAVFWMEISAIFAMALKYAETVLAVSHRRCERGGGFFGGALYYIKDHFQSKGLYRTGACVCAVFAVFLFNILEYAVSSVVVEINVDIGHVDSVRVEESLEEKVVFDRVYIGDFQTVGYCGACG